MATKAKGKKQPATPENLTVGKIGKIDELEYKTGDRRGSNYDAIYAALAKLKAGQQFTVPVPEGVNTRTFHNRTNAAIRRGPVKPPEGTIFRKRTTLDGLVAVCCIKDEAEAAPVKKAAKKAKAAVKPKGEPAPHPQAT